MSDPVKGMYFLHCLKCVWAIHALLIVTKYVTAVRESKYILNETSIEWRKWKRSNVIIFKLYRFRRYCKTIKKLKLLSVTQKRNKYETRCTSKVQRRILLLEFAGTTEYFDKIQTKVTPKTVNILKIV